MSRSFVIFILTVIIFHPGVFGQPTLSFDLKKPQKFENKTLASEKSGDKKFTLPRRFIHNTVTHYNYYFNANSKLNEIVERSKAAYKDDYSKLISFYNYDLKTTAEYKNDLDSVIYKSTAGILLHDLRSNWVDNLYILIGRAYYLRNELDSAFLTFQYVNFAFSPKEDDGYDKIIGSNQNEGGNAFSISTNEKQNIVKKALTRPPSRNESFIWQIRTYLQKNELAEASGLIETLKNDPLFPDRLKNDLEEVQAFWFYKQEMYDSAAFHLDRALDNAENRKESSRWEYLIAQLYERSGNHEMAKSYYNRTIRHTMDPILEVYARLNAIRQNIDSNDVAVQLTIDELVKMARKDRYLFYRDIIYFTAAEIEVERNNLEGARNLLLKSVQNSTSNPLQKSKSFLLLADLSYNDRLYANASRYYDSVDMQTVTPVEAAALEIRKTALKKVVAQESIIERQDSLQRIANMPAIEREAFIRKQVKLIRKQQGLNEDENSSTLTAGILKNNNSNSTQPIDLFRNDNAKGEWYFYNPALKGKGFSEFKAKWGNRPNVDNWRRAQALSLVINNNNNNVPKGGLGTEQPLLPVQITYEFLLGRLPLTPELLQISKDSIQYALYALGKAYQDGLEDYVSAIASYEKLLSDFPAGIHTEEALFNLYYCYGKTGNSTGLARAKQILLNQFPSGNLSNLVKNPDASASPDSIAKQNATKKYQDIYNLFIEGKFAEALKQKQAADSLYGTNYWTPQLLYIQAIYHIRQREDSAAKTILSGIMQLYPSTPIAEKSKKMLDVLGRRKEIETYLTNLKIERSGIDSVAIKVEQPKKQPLNVAVKPNAQPITKAPVNVDTLRKAGDKPVIAPAVYNNSPLEPHYVVLVLDKVDPVYVNEARNAFNRYNKEKFYNKPIEMIIQPVDNDIKLVLFKNFENAAVALDYIEKTKKVTASEIIPWLEAKKYSFAIITEPNLEILRNTKDLGAYRKFLTVAFPNYFK